MRFCCLYYEKTLRQHERKQSVRKVLINTENKAVNSKIKLDDLYWLLNEMK